MAIIKEEKTFKSSSKENIDVYYCVWYDPKKKPIGVIQLTHGLSEHINRYDEMARMFVENGYVVAGQDHVGHGQTTGINHVCVVPDDGAKAMIEDMHKLYKIMHKQYKDLPYFLYGHSLGSMMSRIYIGKYGKDLDAAIICGTLYFPKFSFLLNLPLKLIYKVSGMTYEKEMDAAGRLPMPKTGTNKRTPLKDKITLSWLSYDKKNINIYSNDPLCGVGLQAIPFLLKTFPILSNTNNLFVLKTTPKNLPIYIISGDHDPCGLNGKGVTKVYNEFKETGHNVEFKLYSHAKHEIHNESTKKKEVYADLLNFFNKNNKNIK